MTEDEMKYLKNHNYAADVLVFFYLCICGIKLNICGT